MALCSATKTTANITKMTENDRGGKEIKEISKKVTCSYMVSDLAYSAGACVEQLHLLTVYSPTQSLCCCFAAGQVTYREKLGAELCQAQVKLD